MTLATITFQNYFRMYQKLAGHDRYGEDRGRGIQEDLWSGRHSGADEPADDPRRHAGRRLQIGERQVRAVVEEIVERHETGQPVLVGTVSIENSEQISEMLKKKGIPHKVLNAKYHAEEAAIIARPANTAP